MGVSFLEIALTNVADRKIEECAELGVFSRHPGSTWAALLLEGQPTPFSPPSSLRRGFDRQAGPTQWLFQGPPAQRNFLALGVILGAMKAVSKSSDPQLKGMVGFVSTHPRSKGASSSGHYNGNPETYMNAAKRWARRWSSCCREITGIPRPQESSALIRMILQAAAGGCPNPAAPSIQVNQL